MAETNRVSQALPQPTADGNETSNRGGRYGEQLIQPVLGDKYSLADEGSYFVATNATPGTGIVTTTTMTTYNPAAGAYTGNLLLINTDSITASNRKRIYMDYIKLICVTAPTTGVNLMYAAVLDNNAVRYTSGGTQIYPVCPNCDLTPTTIATLYFGALTVAVANNGRLVARGNLRSTIPVIYDELIILFGAPSSGALAATTVPGRSVTQAPPVIIGPKWNLLLHTWAISTNAIATWELEMGWWER